MLVGTFTRGDMVACIDVDGAEVARGLVNYSAAEASRVLGKPSGEFEGILGYRGDEELIHRDNLVIV
jgi:glutamate 5-kinase